MSSWIWNYSYTKTDFIQTISGQSMPTKSFLFTVATRSPPSGEWKWAIWMNPKNQNADSTESFVHNPPIISSQKSHAPSHPQYFPSSSMFLQLSLPYVSHSSLTLLSTPPLQAPLSLISSHPLPPTISFPFPSGSSIALTSPPLHPTWSVLHTTFSPFHLPSPCCLWFTTGAG